MNNLYDEESFLSTDKLVEFGMSMAVANQMTASMNQAIKNMNIPGAGNKMPNNQQNGDVK